MKKVYGLFLLAVLLFAAGCKLDPPVVPAYLQNSKLLGKWYLKELLITQEDGTTSSLTDFTDKDFFDFKTGNAAIYSSTLYGKSYEGYYSSNSLDSPNTLSFKSGTLVLKYDIYGIDPTGDLVLDEAIVDTDSGVPTTTYYRYTYNKTL
jgi:hypothetical protein